MGFDSAELSLFWCRYHKLISLYNVPLLGMGVLWGENFGPLSAMLAQ